MSNPNLKQALLQALIHGAIYTEDINKIIAVARKAREAREELQEYGVELNFVMPEPKPKSETYTDLFNELKKLIDEKSHDVYRNGKTDAICCIKWVRNKTRLGLKESKEWFDAYRSELGL
jgi:hypothetical protein